MMDEPSQGGGNGSGNVRGRDTATRGLETPGGFGLRAPGGRSASNFDNGGSGSISAPLSPHRLYAQLEMNRPQVPPVWPNAAFASALPSASGASYGMAPVGTPATGMSRSGTSTGIGIPSHQGNGKNGGGGGPYDQEPPSPLPTFAPFSPPAIPSMLKPLNGEPANYISPSTLLSPPNPAKRLVSTSSPLGGREVEGLAEKFGEMGVKPPGKGVENPAGARKEEVASSSGNGMTREGEGGIGAKAASPTPGVGGESIGKKQKKTSRQPSL